MYCQICCKPQFHIFLLRHFVIGEMVLHILYNWCCFLPSIPLKGAIWVLVPNGLKSGFEANGN